MVQEDYSPFRVEINKEAIVKVKMCLEAISATNTLQFSSDGG
jgi:hypothetical protein